MIKRYTLGERYAVLSDGLSGLGFSLKPPKWLRNAAKKLQTKVPKGTVATVDLGTGAPITVDLSDPSSIESLRKQMANAKITVSTGTPTVTTTPAPVSSSIGGSGTALAIAGAAALFFLMRKGK